MKKILFSLCVFLSLQQNLFPLEADLTWKDVRKQFRWQTENVLWCRYRTPSGHLFETAGRMSNGNTLVTYSNSKQNNDFFWSCPDTNDPLQNRHLCSHFLNSGRYNYSDNWFIVNDMKNKNVREKFVSEAVNSCVNNTPHHDYKFVEYGIKSTDDIIPELFHKPFFARTPDLGKNLPFSRIVVFGDSLSDNGNSFASIIAYPKWPYFIGRYSNGLVWIEYITNSLIKNEQSQFDLYNYSVGGGSVTNPGYNPFGIFHNQVKNYLETMKSGAKNNELDPGYESTLFVIFIGTNDYFVLSDKGVLKKLLYCSEFAPEQCAQKVVNGIEDEIKNILKSTNNRARYFVIPKQPEIAEAPYYQHLKATQFKEKLFVTRAVAAHNEYLEIALNKIEKNHPGIKILRLNLKQEISNMIHSPKGDVNTQSKITNVTDACFTGSAKNIKNQTFCDDPASSMFWDGVHLSTTTNCDMGEYTVSEIYKFFGNTNERYTPQYSQCHETYITHDTP